MAENVIIEDLGTALPPWMTEATGNQILAALSSIKTVSDNKDVNESLKKVVENTANSASGGPNSSGSNIKELRKVGIALDRLNRALGGSTEELTVFQKATAAATVGMKSLLKGGVGLLVDAFAVAVGATMRQYKTAMELSAAGVGVVQGMGNQMDMIGALNIAAKDLHLSQRDLVDLSKEYGAVMNKYGIRTFAKVSRNVTANMEQYGVSTQEGSKLMAGYLETLRHVGHTTRLNNTEQMAAAQQQMFETVKWSRILGKSREQIEEQVKQAQASGRAQSFLRRATEEQANAYRGLAASIGEEDAKPLLAALTAPVLEGTEMYSEIMRVSGGEAADEMKALSLAMQDPNASAEDIQARMVDFQNALKFTKLNAMQEQFGVISDSTLSFVGAMKRMSEQSEQWQGLTQEEYEARLKAEKGSAETGVKIQKTITDLSAIAERTASAVFENQGKMQEANANIIDAADKILKRTAELTDALGNAWTEIFVTFTTAVSGVVTWLDNLIDGLKKAYAWIMGDDEPTSVAEEQVAQSNQAAALVKDGNVVSAYATIPSVPQTKTNTTMQGGYAAAYAKQKPVEVNVVKLENSPLMPAETSVKRPNETEVNSTIPNTIAAPKQDTALWANIAATLGSILHATERQTKAIKNKE